eukprot:TRINITY_DN1191_c0_g1_i1.p1 TRINITY_DN1191_c0_g1~~TRINITY_DN1191_c0_g1_i1.p1  ORF type:complete len:513 (+),score=130.17 TRINITY_DN1191_c0_g1_i1:55-1539(+)
MEILVDETVEKYYRDALNISVLSNETLSDSKSLELLKKVNGDNEYNVQKIQPLVKFLIDNIWKKSLDFLLDKRYVLKSSFKYLFNHKNTETRSLIGSFFRYPDAILNSGLNSIKEDSYRELDMTGGYLYALIGSKDGRYMISCQDNGRMSVFDVQDNFNVLHEIISDDGDVRKVWIKEDCKSFVYVSNNGHMIVVSLENFEVLLDYNHEGGLNEVIHYKDKYIVADFNGNIVIIDEQGNKVDEVFVHTSWIWRFALFNNFLLTCGKDNNIEMIDLDNNYAIVKNFCAHEAGRDIRAVKFTHDGKFFLSGAEDGLLLFWNVETGDKVRQMNVGNIWDIYIAQDDTNAVCCCDDGTVLLINCMTGEIIQRFGVGIGNWSSLCVDCVDENYFVVGKCTDSKIRVYENESSFSNVGKVFKKCANELVKESWNGGGLILPFVEKLDVKVQRYLVSLGLCVSEEEFEKIIENVFDLCKINVHNGGNFDQFDENSSSTDDD